ncbi:MAG: heliorhodopsin HeR [Patescibacteria group bacterium]|jgi:hypothetical protein
MEAKLKGLRKFNLVMFLLHLGQGIVMLIVSSTFSLPVTASFLKFDVAVKKLVPTPETLADLKIGPLVASFLFLSAFFHLLITLPGLNAIYNKNLAKHINFFRWIEYSISSSLMIVVIAMLVGIYDIATLIAFVGVNASMILFGWMMELHNQSTEKTNWTSFVFGCIAGIIPWAAIAIYLFGAGGGENKAPDFVYWIYFSIFVFFNSFAINQILQYKKVGKWADYLYGERAYIILSLVAKSLLAWQVFAGTLRP